MRTIFSTEEVMNFMLLDACIEKLQRENVKDSSALAKIKKLQDLKNEMCDEATERFPKVEH